MLVRICASLYRFVISLYAIPEIMSAGLAFVPNWYFYTLSTEINIDAIYQWFLIDKICFVANIDWLGNNSKYAILSQVSEVW